MMAHWLHSVDVLISVLVGGRQERHQLDKNLERESLRHSIGKVPLGGKTDKEELSLVKKGTTNLYKFIVKA